MLYAILKIAVRIAMRIYFRRIAVEGRGKIPKEGPFVIVANHPCTLMDPLSIGIQIRQKISFLAKGTLFVNGFVGRILKHLHMVPVYRAQDDPGKLALNQDIFRDCYRHLGNNGVLMIFPEGISETERRLRKIKTGAARIALGAENTHGFKMGLKILPVGLNYTQPNRFRSRLIMHFGTPLIVSDYRDAFLSDEVTAAKKLTEDIRNALSGLIVVIDKIEHDAVVESVEAIYKDHLLADDEKDGITDVAVSRDIADAVAYFQEHDPSFVFNYQIKIREYESLLNEAGLSDRSVRGKKVNMAALFIAFISLLPGLPCWIYGVINNYLPYKIPGWIAKNIATNRAYYGALSLAFSLATFPLFYGIQLYLFAKLFPLWWQWCLYAISLPVSGLLVIAWSRSLRRFYFNLLLLTRIPGRRFVFKRLLVMRKDLITTLEVAKKKYLTATQNK